jgi:hypothetical protein
MQHQQAVNLLKLTNPDDPKQQAFHIIAPSIPGFAFSSPPTKPGFSVARIASIYHKLMTTLGYTHYLGQGGDWGSFVLAFCNYCCTAMLKFVVSFSLQIHSPVPCARISARLCRAARQHHNGASAITHKKSSHASMVNTSMVHTRPKETIAEDAVVDERRNRLFQNSSY